MLEASLLDLYVTQIRKGSREPDKRPHIDIWTCTHTHTHEETRVHAHTPTHRQS